MNFLIHIALIPLTSGAGVGLLAVVGAAAAPCEISDACFELVASFLGSVFGAV